MKPGDMFVSRGALCMHATQDANTKPTYLTKKPYGGDHGTVVAISGEWAFVLIDSHIGWVQKAWLDDVGSSHERG